MTKELNCCGLACPEPVIRCRRMLQEEKPASLRVLVDNTAASENVGRFLGRNGYSVEVRQEEAALWSVSATACGCRVTEPEPAAATLTPGKTLVLITTETFGRGDDELGEKLMGNFLSTLPELGESLWRVILLNGGVKLAATPGKALDSLKALENAGTDVLVCGTCLDFYGLLEAKQAGQTTNMLDVVTSLALADKVIRPSNPFPFAEAWVQAPLLKKTARYTKDSPSRRKPGGGVWTHIPTPSYTLFNRTLLRIKKCIQVDRICVRPPEGTSLPAARSCGRHGGGGRLSPNILPRSHT